MNYPNLVQDNPDWRQVLVDIVEDTQEFDTDEPIDGADFVEWFDNVRLEIKTALRRAELQVIEEDRWHNA